MEDRIKKVIAEQLGKNVYEITPNANLRDDLGSDSLDEVELVMALEEEFSIEISDNEAEGVTTVKDVIEMVKKKIGART